VTSTIHFNSAASHRICKATGVHSCVCICECEKGIHAQHFLITAFYHNISFIHISVILHSIFLSNAAKITLYSFHTIQVHNACMMYMNLM
jgi:hypothetical protein